MIQTDLTLKYLFKPAKSTITKPKLLLLMHGYGSNEQDLFSFALEVPDDFFIASVRAPKNTQMGGFAWYDINFMDAKKFNNTDQARQSLKMVRRFIAECIEKHDLDEDEVWLCGFSQGAILSYALSLQNPQNIKNVICLSGYPAMDIIGDDFKSDYDDLHFYVSHGTEDAVIPIQWAQQGEVLLKQLNIDYVYKEYRSGHGIVPQNFMDMLSWMNERMG